MVKKLGKYEIQAVLGQGAMGIVYRAYDPGISRLVALKTLTGDFRTNPELLRRFYREAQSAGGLRHFNVVTIYDLGEENGVPYIAMEFLEGSDLEGVIRKGKLQSVNQVLAICRQICDGLHYAHERGIVHRDVKPANVFVLPDNTVKVVDFGIAMVNSSTMTRAGMVMGTVAYMSPEQVQGKGLDGRSDQFSVGIMLYEMLTGRKPFEGGSIPEIFIKIMNQQPVPVRQLYPFCPGPLEAILNRCLQKNRDDRYAGLNQTAEDLRALEGNLKRTFSLREAVVLQAEGAEELWVRDLTEIRNLVESGAADRARSRLEDFERQWRGQKPMLDAEIDNLKARLRSIADQGVIRQRLEVIRALVEDKKYQQAEGMLNKLDQDYPGTPEIEAAQRELREARRRSEKYHNLRSNISRVRLLLESENFDEAVEILEQSLHYFPEEKSLLEFYKKTLERREAALKKKYIQTVCGSVSRLMGEKNIESAFQMVVEALGRYPEEEVFQNLYKNLMSRRKSAGVRRSTNP